MPENLEGLSPIQLDLVNAWAESATLKKEVADYKNAIDVICRSHVNWQELAYSVEDRLAMLSIAVRSYLDKPGSSTENLRLVLDTIAQGPILPRH
jgi:hypothetical protein